MAEPLAFEGGRGATDFQTRFGNKMTARFQDAHFIEAHADHQFIGGSTVLRQAYERGI